MREVPALDRDQLFQLSRINIFSDLDADTLKRLDGISPSVTVAKGKVLLRPFDASAVLYLLKRGRVRLYRLSEDGKMMTLAILGDGNVFGATQSVALHSRDMYAETMDDSLVCAMHPPDVERMLHDHPRVALRLMQVLSARVNDLEEQIASLAHEDVRRRLLHLLATLAQQFGVADGAFVRLNLPLTHADLASMVGSTRETVTTTMSALAREGLVRTDRRQVSVHPARIAAVLDATRPE